MVDNMSADASQADATPQTEVADTTTASNTTEEKAESPLEAREERYFEVIQENKKYRDRARTAESRSFSGS